MIYYGLYLRFSLRVFFIKQKHSVTQQRNNNLIITLSTTVFLTSMVSAELYHLAKYTMGTASASLKLLKHQKMKYAELHAPKDAA